MYVSNVSLNGAMIIFHVRWTHLTRFLIKAFPRVPKGVGSEIVCETRISPAKFPSKFERMVFVGVVFSSSFFFIGYERGLYFN